MTEAVSPVATFRPAILFIISAPPSEAVPLTDKDPTAKSFPCRTHGKGCARYLRVAPGNGGLVARPQLERPIVVEAPRSRDPAIAIDQQLASCGIDKVLRRQPEAAVGHVQCPRIDKRPRCRQGRVCVPDERAFIARMVRAHGIPGPANVVEHPSFRDYAVDREPGAEDEVADRTRRYGGFEGHRGRAGTEGVDVGGGAAPKRATIYLEGRFCRSRSPHD